MPYYRRDEKDKIEVIPVRYVRSSDYKVYYAHGAQGGILGSYHYRIDFFREDIPFTMKATEVGGKVKPDEEIITREIDISVYLSLPFAKQLRDWLDRNIKDFEERHGEIKVVSEPIPKEAE